MHKFKKHQNEIELEEIPSSPKPKFMKMKEKPTKTAPDGTESVFLNFSRETLQVQKTANEEGVPLKVNEERTQMSIFTTNYMIKKKFGLGVSLYFDFLYYMIVSNLVIGIFMTLIWSIQAELSSASTNPLSLIYIESYGSGAASYYIFLFSNILVVVFYILQALIYFYTRRQIVEREKNKNKYLEQQPKEIQNLVKNKRGGYDPNKKHVAKWIRILLTLVSNCLFIFVTLIFCAAICALIYFKPMESVIQEYLDSQLQKVNVPIFSFYDIFISVILFIFYQCLKLVSTIMQNMEIHYSNNGAIKSSLFKFVVGKILLVETMYATNRVVATNNGCPFASAGSTFLSVVLTDLVLTNFFGVLMPFLKYKFPRFKRFLMVALKKMLCCCGKGIDPDDDPDFEIQTEYFEIYFRQFNIMIGSTACPLLLLIGSLTFTIEYVCDKVKLVKFTYKSEKTHGQMIKFNTIFMILTVVLAVFIWPYGIFWITSGDLFGVMNKNYCDCNLFKSSNDILLMQC